MQFNSRRSTVLARNGMVATSQPLAASTGLRVLMEGGNAVDAAVAMAAVLAVVEPPSTGLGGDMFALVWLDRQKQVRALNGSGRAPAAASLDQLRLQGLSHMPGLSPYTITVPGTVHGWHTLVDTYGSMPLARLLQPAIDYAEQGFPVSEVIAVLWDEATPLLRRHSSGQELLLNGRTPRYGDTMRLPEMGHTLRMVAEGGLDAFYQGELAQRIASFVQEQGGWLTAEDMAAHTSTWVEPISTDYRGVTCWQCPPNTAGMAASLALNIAEAFDIASMGQQSADTYHHLIEAMHLAYADVLRYVADPQMATVPTTQLLSKEYAKGRASLVQRNRAMEKALPRDIKMGSDTVYIGAVDGQGNACSFINSVYTSFGTGLVVPGTGIALHNRGALFSLDPAHPNALEPGKRPYHTLMPGMATKDGQLWLCYGVMGAFQQPQGHLQVLVNMIDFGLDPQEALDALRFSIQIGDGVAVEEELSLEVMGELANRGHRLVTVSGYPRVLFGGGQVIERDPATGVLKGGSEPRKDGCAMGW